jgi:hypothetical protein
LKRLRGAPIARHSADYAMVFDPQPPYALLQNSTLDFATVQRVQRLARYWDLLANSGRFARSLQILLAGPSAFGAFLSWSDWLWQRSGKTHEFAHEALVDLLFEHLTQARGLDAQAAAEALLADYRASGARGKPRCLAGLLEQGAAGAAPGAPRAKRQARHSQQHAQQQAQQQTHHHAQHQATEKAALL